MAANVLTQLLPISNLPPPSYAIGAGGHSVTSTTETVPNLARFIGYALSRTRLESNVLFAALLLLQRYKASPTARPSSAHILFITSFMVASKVICDNVYSNESWWTMSQGMFSLLDMNQMERDMCNSLDWKLEVQELELEGFKSIIACDYLPRY